MSANNSLVSNLCRKYSISLLYLFGSQKEKALKLLKGENIKIDDPLADIDLGVVFKYQLPGGRDRTLLYSKIFNELQEIFFPYNTDLVFLEENHSVFQAEAIKGYCIFADNEEDKEAYEEEILRRACDFKPYLEIYYRELLEDLKP